MKNLIYKILGAIFALFIFNSSFLISNCMCQWIQVSNGMGNQTILSLAYIGNSIFAGGNGVYLSTNNGTSWTQTPLNNTSVWSFAVNGNYIFAGTNGGIYLSTNSGTTWTQTSLNNHWVWSLAVNGNNIFAGTHGSGVYLSTNNGTSWTQTSLNQTVGSLAVNGNNVYAGIIGFIQRQRTFHIDSNGVYLSTNNGINWTLTSLINQYVSSLAVNGNNIFAGTEFGKGVYLSTDNGTSWTLTSLNDITAWSLVINGNNIFAGTSGSGVYLSTNNGTSWTQRNEGLGNVSVFALSISNNFIFAGTDTGGVYRRPLDELVDIQPISSEIPQGFSLSQNYPNPFNPKTIINYQCSMFNFVSLKVYDVLGNEIATLVNEKQNPGSYSVDWDASNYPSGIYFYKLQMDNFSETKKMTLIK